MHKSQMQVPPPRARFGRRIPVKDAAVKIKVRVPQRVGRVL
jgi:hypothetical protein